MTALIDGFAIACIPFIGILATIALAGGMEYLWELYNGLTPMPSFMTRLYWRRLLVRLICWLAEIEAKFEQRKSPRKVAASRGMVGQRIRRTEYTYLDIVPQTDPHVKGLQVRKVKRY